MKNILEFLEATAAKHSSKIGFTDNDRQVSFMAAMTRSKQIATALNKQLTKEIKPNSPIVIMIDRNVKCIEAMFGIVYAGCFYTVIDTASPKNRIEHIINILNPVAVISDEKNLSLAEEFFDKDSILLWEDTKGINIDEIFIADRREKMVDTDPMYVLFTSGSSGLPKGAILSHRSVISYINWLTGEFDINEKTSFGSQTPLYFSMSVSDLYGTIKCGCTYNILSKSLFAFPMKLIERMNQLKINTIYWVPSAMGIMCDWDAFAYGKPEHLERVLFAGEPMPMKYLNYWRKHLGHCEYANLFGPTETTDICCFYRVNREFDNSESLPIGVHCDNCNVLLINEEGVEAKAGEEGELFVRGSFLADGYYNDWEKTENAFPQNPLNKSYPERVYRTGDIGKYNEYGEIIYMGRKDFQIKRRGYRIELGEIENAAMLVEGIKKSAVIYDHGKSEIVAFYEGKVKDEEKFIKEVKGRVPDYMCPDRAVRLRQIPLNANGKIDRESLKKDYL